MWIIQIPNASNHNLEAKERWLRPDVAFTIGRDSSNTLAVGGAKSISKVHARITVDPVPSDDVESISPLTIEDLNSKFHTFLTYEVDRNHIELSDTTVTDTVDVTVRLGKAQDAVFKIIWRPFVLALSNVKAAEVSDYCDILDIRYAKEYDELTTLVVTDKYNTPKSLTGMANETWIVAKSYVEEMCKRASELEENMLAMPDLKNPELLPSDEFSREYGHHVFFPNKERGHGFKDLQFVFFSSKQHKNLSMPVRAAKGTSLLYDLNFSAKEVSDYLGTLEKPVVVLPVNDLERTDLLDRLTPLIECKSMTQADFIRVLLSNGTHEVFKSRKTLPMDAEMLSIFNPSDSPIADEHESGLTVEEPDKEHSPKPDEEKNLENAKPVTKRIGSRGYVPLTTFEDDLFGSLPDVTTSQRTSAPVLAPSQSRKSIARTAVEPIDIFDDNGLQNVAFKSQKSDSQYQQLLPRSSQALQDRSAQDDISAIDGDRPSQQFQSPIKRLRSQRKTPTEYVEDFEPAPAAAALERLRSQTQGQREKPLQPDKVADSSPVQELPGTTPKPADITEEEIQRALAANKKRTMLERENSRGESDIDIDNDEQLRNLGTVEFFELEFRDNDTNPTSTLNDRARDVDPCWAGRKNFKRFRRARKGVTSEPGSARPAIMIRLVESAPSDRSLADKTWLETATTRHRDSGRTSQARSLGTDASDLLPRSSRYTSQSQPSTQTLVTESQAAQQQTQQSDLRMPRNSLQSRQSLFMPDDSDSDDDPLKFRL